MQLRSRCASDALGTNHLMHPLRNPVAGFSRQISPGEASRGRENRRLYWDPPALVAHDMASLDLGADLVERRMRGFQR